MPKFSKKSIKLLNECHNDIKLVCEQSILLMDFAIIEGFRSVKRQQELYAQGRTVKGKIITNCDGINNSSPHNYYPSIAIDIVPYPIDWNNITRFKNLAGIIKVVWAELKEEGKLSNKYDLVWGGDWKNLKDYPHYELVRI